MRQPASLLFALLLLLAACQPLRGLLAPPPARQLGRQLGRLLTAHPELLTRDTVLVHDTITVPVLRVETRFVGRTDPVRASTDSLRFAAALDSLLHRLQTSLDTAGRRAAVRGVQAVVGRARPRFPDTLCFDTLGLRGQVWRTGAAYRLRLTRAETRLAHAVPVLATTLHPCDCPTAPLWHDPRTWPWAWLLAGFAGGVFTCLLLRRR